MHTAALDQLATLDLGPWPSSRNGPAGLFGSHGPARPSLAADQHAVADRGVRRCALAGVVFPIADGDEGGLNMEQQDARSTKARPTYTIS
jgi:hypothetical protein